MQKNKDAQKMVFTSRYYVAFTPPSIHPLDAPQIPSIFNLGLFYQYLRVIGRAVSTPAFALTHEACFSAICAHFFDPFHALAVQLIIIAHHLAVVLYDIMTDPQHHDAPAVDGSASWLEFAVLMVVGLSFQFVVGFMYGTQMERMRRSDAQLRARALALHASTERLMRNFLPAAVLNAVNRRSAGGGGSDADIVAWSFDPACVLQSDIVGFTALGSRISPEDLCGCGLAFPSRSFHLFLHVSRLILFIIIALSYFLSPGFCTTSSLNSTPSPCGSACTRSKPSGAPSRILYAHVSFCVRK